MLSRVEAVSKDEVFLPLSRRKAKGVYFLRLADYSESLENYIWQFHEEARQRGAIIENQISNPDDRQLSYYSDVLGTAFQPKEAFVLNALKKWMPRMNASKKSEFAAAMNKQFEEMKAAGKNENIQKNVYIKMMCWLYYKFERLMPFLGDDKPPKVLYEGSTITNHELIFLRIVSSMGTDILLLETKGDNAYLRLDPSSKWSQRIEEPGVRQFPQDYSLKSLRKEKVRQIVSTPTRAVPQSSAPPRVAPVPAQHQPTTPLQRQTQSAPVRPTVQQQQPIPQRPQPVQQRQSIPQRPQPVQQRTAIPPQQRNVVQPQQRLDAESRFPAPGMSACTNAWMKEPDLSQILLPPIVRGDDRSFFYNAFIRMNGVNDKLTYANELYQLYQNLVTNHRKNLVIDGAIPTPEPEELQKIRRRSYKSVDELIIDLAGNLPACASVELQRSIQRSFVRTMKEAAKSENNLNRLTVTAVYILCWILRYQGQIFQGWKETDIPVFIKMGPCESVQESLYVIFLSQLPVDVLVLAPNLNQVCLMKSDKLLEITGKESLPVMKFPKQSGNLQMRTVAAHAEEELSSILYTDTGIFRNRQFEQAQTITLQTTYDEIFILWDKELKYRPNFSTANHIANIPVIFAKISGVEEGKTIPYWQKIKMLKDASDTLLIKQMPLLQPGETNRFQSLAIKGIKNEKIKRDVIKSDRQYPFGLLREEMEEHVFNKLQEMLDQRVIKGTFQNGTEFTILATILNMKKELMRLIQGFDFTKKNPKIVVINTRDQAPSLEDTILLTFLNKLGFDIILFIPTGYQTIERYLNDNFPVEHQIGDYVYDLSVPDFDTLPTAKGLKWLNNMLRRGF